MNILFFRYSPTFFYPTGFQGKRPAQINYDPARIHLKSSPVWLALSQNPDYRLLVERSTYFCQFDVTEIQN
jgi:hypothetical protein